MTSIWMSDALLSFACFTTFMTLIRRKESHSKLAALAIGLLSIASLIGTIRFGLILTNESWLALHNFTSRVFGVAGLYLLIFAWLDFSGLLRIRSPWYFAHCADAALIFGIAFWLNFLDNTQLIVGILMNGTAVIAAIIFHRNHRRMEAKFMVLSALVFIVNGLVIGGSMEPLVGPLLRIDVFHILFALWALYLRWQFQRSEIKSPKWKLP